MSNKSTKTVAMANTNAPDFKALAKRIQAIHNKIQAQDPEQALIAECIDKMHPRSTDNQGNPLNFKDVFFVIRMVDDLRPMVQPYYPYPTHVGSNGVKYYARKAKPELLPAVQEILKAYGIVAPEGVLEDELDRINNAVLKASQG